MIKGFMAVDPAFANALDVSEAFYTCAARKCATNCDVEATDLEQVGVRLCLCITCT